MPSCVCVGVDAELRWKVRRGGLWSKARRHLRCEETWHTPLSYFPILSKILLPFPYLSAQFDIHHLGHFWADTAPPS